MDFLPIFVATKDRKIVVVGQGQMADAKCRGVLKTAANVMVFADTPSVEAQSWAKQALSIYAGLPSAHDFEEQHFFTPHMPMTRLMTRLPTWHAQLALS